MSTPGDPQAALESLVPLLDRSLRALAAAGEPDAACRLAAEAWWLLREPCPRGAHRMNATLHRLTRPATTTSTPRRG